MAVKGFIFTVENPLNTESTTILISVKHGHSDAPYFLLETFEGAYATPRQFDEAVSRDEQEKTERIYNIVCLNREGLITLAEKIHALNEALDTAT